MIVRYEHHGRLVFADQSLIGRNREHCLCYKCDRFKPHRREKNCPIANRLFKLCCDHGLVTPVYECPQFKERSDVDRQR